MTVSYNLVAASSTFANARLLGKWKASIYQLFFKEFAVYCTLYILLSLLYRFAFDASQRQTFELLCIHIDESLPHIPLTFVLGFYVSLVVSRWWDQLNCYPWPDRLLYLIIYYINGSDERSRMTRRMLARYLNLTTVLLTRTTSIVTKKRFPLIEHLVEAGLMTEEEFNLYQEVKLEYGKFWVPLVWFTQALDRAKDEGLLKEPVGGSKLIMKELMDYRSLLGKLFLYDWVSIPLSYTQVVTLATYSYFVGCLFSRQFLDPTQKYKGHHFDIYVPLFTILQFMFYVGWLKVAESLINPWGEHDDDFEVNWFIDRHLQVSFAVVDDMHMKTPLLVRDKYWGKTQIQVPYTIDTINLKRGADFTDLGSVAEYFIPVNKQRASLTVPISRRESLANIHPSTDMLTALHSNLDLGIRKRSIFIPHKPFDNMEVIIESPTTEGDSLESVEGICRFPGQLNLQPAATTSDTVKGQQSNLPFIDSSKNTSQYGSNENLNHTPWGIDKLTEETSDTSIDDHGWNKLLQKYSH